MFKIDSKEKLITLKYIIWVLYVGTMLIFLKPLWEQYLVFHTKANEINQDKELLFQKGSGSNVLPNEVRAAARAIDSLKMPDYLMIGTINQAVTTFKGLQNLYGR